LTLPPTAFVLLRLIREESFPETPGDGATSDILVEEFDEVLLEIEDELLVAYEVFIIEVNELSDAGLQLILLLGGNFEPDLPELAIQHLEEEASVLL
jgi:hypothetical protein